MSGETSKLQEGCGREGSIRCIFLSEFDPHVGSQISVQVPEDFITKDVFHAINDYIIPKSHQLHDYSLTVNTLGYKIVGYPVKIVSSKYLRNAYLFNICFVCYDWARTSQYEPVVKKLAEYVRVMEENNNFVSIGDKQRISNFLKRIMRDLNEKKESSFIESETTIFLKIMEQRSDTMPVREHEVPILDSRAEKFPLDTWDLTTRRILPYINGSNHVAKIAADANVDINLVKSSVQNLVHFDVVQVVPIFKYSNIYMCTRKLQRLTKDTTFLQMCRRCVADNQDRPLPTLQKILSIYSAMTHGVTLRTICLRLKPRDFNIDEKKLVNFGLISKLIRCVQKYPIHTGYCPVDTQSYNIYNGLSNIDEICCKTMRTTYEIDQDVDRDTSLVVLWK